jgi:hypothetical protein
VTREEPAGSSASDDCRDRLLRDADRELAQEPACLSDDVGAAVSVVIGDWLCSRAA